MTNETVNVNGWTNRETWLVNLHFGDSFYEHLTEDIGIENVGDTEDEDDIKYGIRSEYQLFVDMMIEEEIEGLSTFLRDLINLDNVDWDDLADTLYDDLK